jgi:hypothetical protein
MKHLPGLPRRMCQAAGERAAASPLIVPIKPATTRLRGFAGRLMGSLAIESPRTQRLANHRLRITDVVPPVISQTAAIMPTVIVPTRWCRVPVATPSLERMLPPGVSPKHKRRSIRANCFTLVCTHLRASMGCDEK